MDTTTLILTEFLLARIEEDDAVQRSEIGWGMCEAPEEYHWPPERVLAECAAKRRIVGLHGPDHEGGHECPSEPEGGSLVTGFYDGDCPTIRAIASVYADHPDYREEWR